MITELRRFTFGLAALASCVVALEAQARSVSGFAGRALNPEEAGCFHEAWGVIYNDGCPNASPIWEVSLPVDNAGGHDIDVVTGFGLGRADCVAYSVDANALNPRVNDTPSFPGSARHFSVWVLPGGTLQVWCKLPFSPNHHDSGGGMASVNWNP